MFRLTDFFQGQDLEEIKSRWKRFTWIRFWGLPKMTAAGFRRAQNTVVERDPLKRFFPMMKNYSTAEEGCLTDLNGVSNDHVYAN